MIQLVAKNTANELIKIKMQLPCVKCSTNGVGVMRLHNNDEIEGIIDKCINMVMHVNDGAWIFNCREDREKAA